MEKDYSKIVNEEKFKEFSKIVMESYKYYIKLCKKYDKVVGEESVRGIMENEFQDFICGKVCRGDKSLIFKKSIENDPERKIYRGIASLSIDSYLQILKSKNSSVYRMGAYGEGLYFSADKTFATRYSDSFGGMIFATMGDDCKITNPGNLVDERYEFNKGYMQSPYFAKLPREIKSWCKNNIIFNNRNNTFYAGFLGYDAIRVEHVYCIFNLDKIVIEDKKLKDNIEIKETKKNIFAKVFGK